MVRDCHSLVYHSRQTIQIQIVLWYAWSASLLVLANLSSSTREDLRTWAPLYLTLRLIITAVQRFPNEGLIGDTRGVCWRVKDIIVTIAFVNAFLFHSDQRWANNSVFEYYSNTWDRILVFVFVFGWLFETEYYSYSYSGDFLKTNIIRIRIRVIFSNRILFVFVFGWFSQTK